MRNKIIDRNLNMEGKSAKDWHKDTAKAVALATAEEAFSKLDHDGNGKVDLQKIR